jgi:disulfide bond formation protein DsbB
MLTPIRTAALIAFGLGLVAILGAWASQIWGGLSPCELCLGERVPYYWGLPILLVILLLWNRLPATVWTIAMIVVAAIFVWSVYLGAYHAGVEWKFWPGPTACTGGAATIDLSQLANLDAAKSVVPCDVVQWRDPILKLSLAGYNAILSLVIAVLLIGAIVARRRKSRRAALA